MIEALGGVHDGLRKLLNGALAEWKSTVRDAIARYVEINGGNAIGLSVAEFNENGTVKSHINIFDDLLLRLERLTRRNGSLINLRRRYVTNELLPPKKSRTRKKARSEEHTSELQSLMRISYAVFCLKQHINTKQKMTPKHRQ